MEMLESSSPTKVCIKKVPATNDEMIKHSFGGPWDLVFFSAGVYLRMFIIIQNPDVFADVFTINCGAWTFLVDGCKGPLSSRSLLMRT